MSTLDIVVLLIGFSIAAELAAVMFWQEIAIAFVIGHFFLFCNVIRMARPRELVWAAISIALTASTNLLGWPSWPLTFAISFAATIVLVALEMRKLSYHGVFWQRINPNLPAWWEANGQPIS